MSPRRRSTLLGALVLAAVLAAGIGCESYPWLPGFGKTGTAGGLTGDAFPLGDPFTDVLIQGRTFVNGTSVTTATYATDDRTRQPLAIDFNSDGRVDPVVGYGETQAVIQILLSRTGTNAVNPISLTLDSKRDMQNLADVAVGDLDNDGNLDIVAAAAASVWYFHHPSSGDPTDLRDWGNTDPNATSRERIEASYTQVTDTELQAIITQAIGPGVNLDDYIITVQQLYTNVEIGDFDNDGDNDIATSRSFQIDMQPRPDSPVTALQIVDGDVMVFVNPGFATDGQFWTLVSIGKHERQQRLDRDGASGLVIFDVDADGFLDVISTARDDNNAQIAWFRNPGRPLATENTWTQYRLGSLRDSWAVDVADVTGDGWPDVVATGAEQMQTMLFEHPGVAFPNDRYEYDWESYVITTFTSYEPRDAKLLDVDNDAVLELVVGGTMGALRYFEPPADPRSEWTGVVIATLEGEGDVGLLGYGDLDGDNDVDLVATLKTTDLNASQTLWIRNDLAN